MGKATFKKAERLSSEKHIRELFQKGSSFNLYPFKVIFQPHPQKDYPCSQVLISVSARLYKKAVDRNTIKRRIREGYRLFNQKASSTSKFLIAYIYTAKEIHPSEFIHHKLNQTFQRIYIKDHEKK